MQTKVTMLKESEWDTKQWDSAKEIMPLPTENMYEITVNAATHREAFRLAYQAKFGVAPPEESVKRLINYRITKGKVTFYVQDDYLPVTGMPAAHPEEMEIVRED